MPKRLNVDPSEVNPLSHKERRKKLKEKRERKRDREAERLLQQRLEAAVTSNGEAESEAPAVVQQPEQQPEAPASGRKWTLSIAVPSSIADNAQSAELRTYLAGQVARAAVVFQVDEVVLFDEYSLSQDPLHEKRKSLSFMAKVLQYLECPQYLRKFLFPLQQDLRFAGLLNPLDCKHHLKTTDLSVPFREGVVLNKRPSDKRPDKGSSVYIGLDQEARIDRVIEPGVRVTVQLDPSHLKPSSSRDHVVNVSKNKGVKGIAVSPSDPRLKHGLYWGYAVRIADSLSHVLNDCPFEGGYDLTIGTSERGDDVDEVSKRLPNEFNHALIVFGGLKGIEAALDSDPRLQDVPDPKNLFHVYLNTCPDQGSNTIRTEEAILITLSSLRPFLCKRRQ